MDKANFMECKWSRDGKFALIKVESMHDEKNKSYYGENNLYHFDKLQN